MWGYPGPGFGGFEAIRHLLGLVVGGLAILAAFAIVLVVAIALVRFLWFGTQAAQRYLALNPAPEAPAQEPAEESDSAPEETA